MKTNFLEYLKNDRGLGMVEVLIGSVISLTILAATTTLFTRNQDRLNDQNDSVVSQAKGRLAVDRIEEELRMAGFGLPPGQGVTDISTANSISFRSNLNDIRTTTPPCTACPGAIAGSVGDTTLTVVDATGFCKWRQGCNSRSKFQSMGIKYSDRNDRWYFESGYRFGE